MAKHLLLLLIVSVLFSQSTKCQTKLNLDFEQIDWDTHLPSGWGLDNIRNKEVPTGKLRVAFTTDSIVKHSGQYSLSIDWKTRYKEWTASNYVIHKAFAGGTIKLTGWVKTKDVDNMAGLWMRLDGDNGANLGLTTCATAP